jgi:hypothetical protein
LKPTDIKNPDYFHKVVDCQWACPAHTPVPEYIRLIAHGRYSDAYMINWKSNVFPGIHGGLRRILRRIQKGGTGARGYAGGCDPRFLAGEGPHPDPLPKGEGGTLATRAHARECRDK